MHDMIIHLDSKGLKGPEQQVYNMFKFIKLAASQLFYIGVLSQIPLSDMFHFCLYVK